MIEEVSCACSEVGDVEGPSAEGNGDAELVLLVALAMEREKTQALLRRDFTERIIGSVADGQKRRGLIVATVESAKDPVEMWDANRRADARIGGIFAGAGTEVSEAHASVESQPGCHFVLVFEEKRFYISPNSFAII